MLQDAYLAFSYVDAKSMGYSIKEVFQNCASTEDGILVTYEDDNKILLPIKSGDDAIVVDVSADNKYIIIKMA